MLETIKKKYWIRKKEKELLSNISYELAQLSYFNNVRENNFLRKDIGRKDLSIRIFHGLKHNSKYHTNSSEKNSIAAIYFYLLELKKLSKLSKNNLIPEPLLKSFFSLINQEYNPDISLFKLKKFVYSQEKEDSYNLPDFSKKDFNNKDSLNSPSNLTDTSSEDLLRISSNLMFSV